MNKFVVGVTAIGTATALTLSAAEGTTIDLPASAVHQMLSGATLGSTTAMAQQIYVVGDTTFDRFYDMRILPDYPQEQGPYRATQRSS